MQLSNSPRPREEESEPKKQATPSVLITNAESVRKFLGEVPETVTPEEWLQTLEAVENGPPAVSTFTQKTDVPLPTKQNAYNRYIELQNELRNDASKILKALPIIAKAIEAEADPSRKIVLQEAMKDAQEEAKQHVAIYLKKLHEYELIIGHPDITPFPSYLAQYVAPENKEVQIMSQARRLFRIQYDVRRNRVNEQFATITNEQERTNAINTALQRPLKPISDETSRIAFKAIQRDLQLKDLQGCLQAINNADYDSEEFANFLKKIGYPEDQITPLAIEAAQQFAGTIKKYDKKITERLKLNNPSFTEEELATLKSNTSVTEALQSFGASAILMQMGSELNANAMQIISGNLYDFSTGLESALSSMEALQSGSLDIALRKAANNNGKPLYITEKEYETIKTQITEFMYNPAKNIGYVMTVKDIESETLFQSEYSRLMLSNIKQNVASPEYKQVIAQNIEFANEGLFSWKKETTAFIHTLISSEALSIKDTFELYYIIEGDLGALPLSIKLMDVLKKNGRPDLAANMQYGTLNGYIALALSDPEGAQEQLEELGYSEEMQVEMQNMGEFLNEQGLSFVGGFYNRVKSFTAHYPVLALISGLTTFAASTGALYGMAKGAIALDMMKVQGFISGKVDLNALAEKIKQPNETLEQAKQRVVNAQKEANSLLSEYRQRVILFTGGERTAAKQVAKLAVIPGSDWEKDPAKQQKKVNDAVKKLKSKSYKVDMIAKFVAPLCPNQEVAKTALSTQFTEVEVENAMKFLDEAKPLTEKTLSEEEQKAADLKQAEQNINSTDTTKRQRRNIGSERQTVAGAGEAKQELEINPTTEEGTSKKADGDSNIKGKK